MRPESEIKSRVVEILTSELDHRVEESTRRLPHLCTHHYAHPLDSRKIINGEPNKSYNRISLVSETGNPLQTIGLCVLGSDSTEQWGGTICEEPVDAKKCPYFKPSKSRVDLLRELEEDLQSLEWIQENLPELHVLLWVLHSEISLKIPWWKRILFKLSLPFIRLEAKSPQIDPLALLPPVQ